MILRLCLILLAALLAVELALQLLFLHLPPNLIQRMPQYQDRAGYRLETEHGARELPANTQIDVLVTPLSGDLYRLELPRRERWPSLSPVIASAISAIIAASATPSPGRTISSWRSWADFIHGPPR